MKRLKTEGQKSTALELDKRMEHMLVALHYGVFSHQSCLVWLKWTLVRFPCECGTFAMGQQSSLDVDQNSMTRTSLKRWS